MININTNPSTSVGRRNLYAGDTMYKKFVQETCMSVIATCTKIFLVQISCMK